MEWDNSMIVSGSGRIIHLGEQMLNYIELNREQPVAYPAAGVERDDLVLFVSRCLEEDGADFSRIGIESVQRGMGALFLGAFDNPEIQPIEKCGQGLFGTGSTLLLDTFFSGRDVMVTWEENETLRVRLAGQEVLCTLSQGADQMIVMGEGGIRYFRRDEPDSRLDSCGEILQGRPWHSYVDRGRVVNMTLKDLFSPELIRAFWQIGQGEIKTLWNKGKPLSLRYRRTMLWGLDCHQYSIADQSDILRYMNRESELYLKLKQAQAEQHREKMMATTFHLWGSDSGLADVRLLLQKASGTGVTVLLTGESGTGKTFLAREIHKNSRRCGQEFIHVNCAAIPYQLIESELFGYEDGAFTGAKRGGRKGYFELADGGTIFLDEITEMPLSLQGKLLEVIQNRTFYRVGGMEKISVNVRLIAATNRDLKEQVAAREFREDLYYRINVFPIELPPLRRRKGAILSIVTEILPGICEKVELEPLIISPQALNKMNGYNWPGNIRELENVLEKAAILCDGKVILPADIVLPEEESFEERGTTLKERREQEEKKAILEALERFKGDKTKAAGFLDVGRSNLFDKIKKYNIRGCWIGGEDDTESNK